MGLRTKELQVGSGILIDVRIHQQADKEPLRAVTWARAGVREQVPAKHSNKANARQSQGAF